MERPALLPKPEQVVAVLDKWEKSPGTSTVQVVRNTTGAVIRTITKR